jgi:lactate dehydrogenase-like 2-hydroxyacid dehydrogenase
VYLETIDGDEAVKAWERYVGQFKRKGVDVDDKEPTPFMERIWTLSAVRTDRQRCASSNVGMLAIFSP